LASITGWDIRAVFPHDIPGGTVEPSCGTGSVAIGVAIVTTGEIKREDICRGEAYQISLETGGGSELGGPERTTLLISSSKSVITDISFTHSLVKITTVGEIII